MLQRMARLKEDVYKIREALPEIKPGRDLHDYWRIIPIDGDLLGPPPSYTSIKDPVLRLCHRMMAHSIASRSQAPKNVTVPDLFYLRGLDVGSTPQQPPPPPPPTPTRTMLQRMARLKEDVYKIREALPE
nr:hypothetical protein [Tanacetum cinerariifolium]